MAPSTVETQLTAITDQTATDPVKPNYDAKDTDAALSAIQSIDNGQVVEIDAATNKRLLRIIDTHLLPMSNAFSFSCSMISTS